MTINQYQLLPDLSPDEYAALRDDIALRGVMVPVEIDDDLNILDGHHRVMICEELGIDYPVITRKDMSEDEKIEHVLSLNLNRRHLNDGQMKELISELRIKGYSIRKIADMTAIPQTTVYRKLQGVPNGTPDHVEGADGKTYPAQQRKPEPVPVLFGDDTKGIKKAAREINREQIAGRRQDRIEETPVMPDGKYNVIYADPPWKYDYGFDIHGAADRHYPTMTVKELCELPIPDIVETNAVLFLWTTSPKLFDSSEIIKAWGFEYKTSFIWDKIKHVMGHYNSVRHEFLLVCVKGSFPKQSDTLHDSVISIERSDKHSEKPIYFRELIEDMYPRSKKIELFARAKIEGWDTWGQEA